ncbi:Sly41 protein [Maudiozyma humilis]|uniref:Sly41 protein n=1 Tax=Maudiozyma humilis TaxID=51915 RepID=A0AAV5S4Z6_MAUHU|nr:Sly41 protein [Kazachstania humilis]
MSYVETNRSSTVAKKRRNSEHKNLFDPNLYSLPSDPNGNYESRKAEKIRAHTQLQHGKGGSIRQQFQVLWQSARQVIPPELHGACQNVYEQDFWPTVDLKVAVLCLMWYISSSVSNNLAKSILRKFPHPVGFTELQFLVSGLICLAFACVVNACRLPSLRRSRVALTLDEFPQGIIPTYMDGNFTRSVYETFLRPGRVVLLVTFPLGLFQFFGHLTAHKATSLTSISLVHSIKALSPIATVAYYAAWEGREYNAATYYTLLVLIGGVVVTCYASHSGASKAGASSASDSLAGIIYAFMSMAVFVSQNIFAKGAFTAGKKDGNSGVLTGKNKKTGGDANASTPFVYHSAAQVDKITIQFYCSAIGFVLTLFPFLTNELWHGTSLRADLTGSVVLLIITHGLTHFIQAILAFQLLGLLSPVNYSVANIMKRLVVIAVALAWETHVSGMQLLGLVLTMAGLYGYDRWGVNRG